MIKLTPTEHVIHAAISGQKLQYHLHELRATNQARHKLKQKIANIMPDLVELERQFDKFDEHAPDITANVYNVNDAFIAGIAKIPVHDQPNIIAIIEAYYKDPKSINGIVNKILNQ